MGDFFATLKDNAINALNEIQNAADGVDIGAGLNDPEKQKAWAEALNQYALATGMTADQMQSFLSSVGVTAHVDMAEGKEVTRKIPITKITRTTPKLEPVDIPGGGTAFGFTQYETSKIEGYKEVSEPTLIPQISFNDEAPEKPIFTRTSFGTITPSATIGGKSNGGGGKKGGGGSSKNNKPTKVKPTEQKEAKDEVERYHEINEELDDLKENLSNIQDIKDELWGADKIAQMEKERKELNKITEAHKRYQQQIAQNLSADQQEAIGVGAIIDSDTGRITNYEALQRQWMDEWNAKSGQFDIQEQDIENRLAAAKNAENEALQSALEDEKDRLSDAREANDKEYERKRETIDQYEETLNLSEEANSQLKEYLRQIRELNYERLQYKLEIRVELNEQDLNDIEHRLNRLDEDDITKTAERLALINKQATLYSKTAQEARNTLAEAQQLYQQYLNTNGQEGIDQAKYFEMLDDVREKVLDAETSIREGIETIADELTNAFDLADEKIDKTYERLDNLTDLMDHFKEVVSLTKGENAFVDFNKILKAQQEITRKNINTAEIEKMGWHNQLEYLQLELNQATSEELKKQLEKQIEDIKDKIAEADQQIRDGIQKLGEYAKEIFENAIEEAAQSFEENLFGRPLNSIIESIDLLNSKQEELLTTTNKIYETNKLIRTVEKDMDATSNKRAKQVYQEFINKAKQKQEQNELTQFELDLLNAEYEITKAQIALEEAQNAKDTVRLTRDSEGNFGYVYTANENKVSDAQQSLEDAQNNYYNIALDGLQKYQDQYYQHIQEWEDKLKEVVSDQTLSEEEKNKKIREINDTYHTMLLQDEDLFTIAKNAMKTSAYEHQVDYDTKGIKSSQLVFDNMNEFLDELKTAQNEYEANTEEVSDKNQEHYGELESAIRDTKKEAEALERQAAEDMAQTFGIDLPNAIDEATAAWSRYIKELEKVKALSNEMMKVDHETKTREAYKDEYAAEIKNRIANGANYGDYEIQKLLEYRWDKLGGNDNTDYKALIDSGEYSGIDLVLLQWLRQFKVEQIDQKAAGNFGLRDEKLNQDYENLIDQYLEDENARWTDSQVQKYLMERQVKIDERGLAGKVKSNEQLKIDMQKKYPYAFFTGGYTGTWGPEGKLAVLHEKELVLNAQDTENILSSVNILRQISQALDNSAIWASLGLGGLNAASIGTLADQTLQQEVYISADFPNVTDHNEIEMAIDNLINAASQYAYRR